MANLPWTPKSKDGGGSASLDVVERKPDHEEEFDSLEGAMSELHSALNAKKYKEAAQIFRSAFDLLDSEPHIEGAHINGD